MMKQPAFWTLTILFLLGTNFVNADLIEEAHKAGLTDEQIKHEADMAHKAGITDAQIQQELDHAHAAGMTDEQILNQLHNAQQNGQSEADIINHIKDAEQHNGSNNGNHNGNHANDVHGLIDEAHKAGLTNEQIAHEAHKAQQAGITHEQAAKEVEHLHQEGKTDAEIVDMAMHAEQAHSGNGSHNGNESHSHNGNESHSHNGNGSHSGHMTEADLLDAAHHAGLSNEDIKKEAEIAHQAGFSNEQIAAELNAAHNSGMSNHDILDKIHSAEHHAMQGHHTNSGSHNGNGNHNAKQAMQNHVKQKVDEANEGAHAFYTGDEAGEHVPDGISKGELAAYVILSSIFFALFGVFLSFFWQARKERKNKKVVAVEVDDEQVEDRDIV